MVIEEEFRKFDEEVENLEAKATVKDYFKAGWEASLKTASENIASVFQENIHLQNKCAMYQNECFRLEKEKRPGMAGTEEYEFRKNLDRIIDFLADHENCRECFHFSAMVTNIVKNDNGECTLYPCEQCDWNSDFLKRN